MEKKIKWRDLLSAVIGIIIVLGGGELTNTVDVGIEGECPECEETNCPPQIECPRFSIAYVNNCRTGETDKYVCRRSDGKCRSIDEILSELG